MSELTQRKVSPKEGSTTTEKKEETMEKKPEKTPMQIAQEKYSAFFTRSIWGSLMILVFGGILSSDHYLVCLFVVILQIVVFREMIALRYAEAKEKNLYGFRTVHWWFLFVTFFYVYGSPFLQHTYRFFDSKFVTLELLLRYHLAISFALYVVGFIAFIVTLKKNFYKYQFGQLTWTLMTLLLVVGQSNFIIQNILKGLFWLVLPSSLIICNDIMAYFCGLMFGRKFIDRPLTSLSQNKTWEGFIGSLICTLIWSFIFSGFLAQFQWFTCPKDPITSGELFSRVYCTPDPVFIPQTYQYNSLVLNIAPVQFHSLIFALFASLIAPFGGFFASGIKRAYQIKDFDSLFPGHGGMTDRMDCQFIMGLFTYVYYATFLRPMLDPAQILETIYLLPVDKQTLIWKELSKRIQGVTL